MRILCGTFLWRGNWARGGGKRELLVAYRGLVTYRGLVAYRGRKRMCKDVRREINCFSLENYNLTVKTLKK